MAQQIIDVGNVANDGQGDPLRTAFIKTNENFTELYNAGGISGIQNGTSNITIAEDSTINMAVDGVSDVFVVNSTGVTVAGEMIANVVSTVGNVYSNYYLGNGSLLSGLSTQNANSLTGTTLAASVVNSGLTRVGTLGTLSVTGNINTGSNVVTGANVLAGNITSSGALAVGQGATFGFGITAGGTVSAVGNIVGNNIIGNFVFSTISTSSNVVAGNVNTSGIVSAGGSILGSAVTTSGNITGNYFIGNGSQLTGLPSGYSNANVAAYLPTYTGNLAGQNLSLSGNIISLVNTTSNITTTANISGNYLLGNGSFITGIVATEVGTLTSLSVTGNATIGNISTGIINSGTIYATSLSLSGTVLSNLISGSDISTTANVLTGNATVYGDLSVDGNLTAGLFEGGAVEVENHVWVGSTGNSIWTSGNVTGANLVSTGAVSTVSVVATGNVTGGNISTGGVASVTSTITGGNLLTGGLVSATGNIRGGNLNTAGLITATGNITGGNISTGGLISATGNIITTEYFIGNFLGNITGNLIVPGSNTWVLYNNNGNAGASAGLVFDSTSNALSTQTVYADNFIGNGRQLTGVEATSIGVLPSLSITGNVDAGNLRTAGLITATGNIVGGNINTGGLVSTSGNIVAGNITSNLFEGGAVEVENHVWVGNIGNSIWTAGNITGDQITGNLIASAGIISATGNINSAGNVNTDGDFSATGSLSAFGVYGNAVEVESHVWVGNTGNSIWTAGNVTGASVLGNTVSASGNVTGNNVTAVNLMVLSTHATDPAGIQGAIYYNTTYNTFRVFNGSLWANITTS